MSELQIISVLIMRESMMFSGGKIFTLPLAVSAVTNLTSGNKIAGWMKVCVGVCHRQRDIFNVSNISTSTHAIGQIAPSALDIVHF